MTYIQNIEDCATITYLSNQIKHPLNYLVGVVGAETFHIYLSATALLVMLLVRALFNRLCIVWASCRDCNPCNMEQV